MPNSGGFSNQSALDRPRFHVAPAAGWVNDPNGPFMYKGQYHLFYQHLPEGCEWAFGLVWGHAVSADLIHWEHLPHAMVPTAKSLDAAGCFSGCAIVDTDGTPVLLYTGVRLRTDSDAQPLPPPECDLNLPFIESQLFAVPANPGDPLLVEWVKEAAPFIGLPPPNMNLTGWRDPFVVERPCEHNNYEWVVLMGSGIKDVGGATIVYRTRDLRDPAAWRYDGMLCTGEGDTGAVWECPLIAQLNPAPAAGIPLGSSSHCRLACGTQQCSSSRSSSSFPQLHSSMADGPQQQQQQIEPSPYGDPSINNNGSSSSSSACSKQQQQQFSRPFGLVNPAGGGPPGFDLSCAAHGSWDERYTHFYSISPDACTNPTIYWLGRYAAGRFDLDNAKGPVRLDLGDVLYAPNVFRDDEGRVILWGWLQERRTVGTYDYAGCMTVPRLMFLEGDRLVQCPAPEILSLRQGKPWEVDRITLGGPHASLPVPGQMGSSYLDIEAVFSQGSASTVGVFLRSWQQGGEGGAAVLFNWESGLLEVVFEALDPATMTFSLTAPMARRIGGPIQHRPGQPLALRLLLDVSCLEIFTGTGEVLSTRVYRGTPSSDHADSGIEFVALDGNTVIERVAVHQMSTIWEPSKRQWQQRLQQQQQQEQQMAAAAAVQEQFDSMFELIRSPADFEQQQDTTIARKLSNSLSNSLTVQPQLLALPASPLTGVAGQLEQLALAPTLGAAAATAAEPVSEHVHELPPEEEMCADIFDFEAL